MVLRKVTEPSRSFIYAFDAALMFAYCIIMNVFHPSKLLSRGQAGYKADVEHEILNQERARNY
jgi:hypothetical protein